MGLRVRKPIRMAGPDVSVPVSIRRRGLRQPRRITDRAEIDRRCMNVVADRLQPLQYRLPLFPIQLPQERPQSLNERILEQRFPVGFRNKEPVQPDAQRLRNLLQRPEARRHLPALDARQIRTRHLRARLQLALRHRARFAQLANPLADILDRLLVYEFFRRRLSGLFLRRCRGRNQELQTLRQGAHASPAISRARPVLDETTSFAADDFPIHFQRNRFFFQLCRHRYSSLTVFFRRADRMRNAGTFSGKAVAGASGVSCASHFLSRVFLNYFKLCSRVSPCLRPAFACPSGHSLPLPTAFSTNPCVPFSHRPYTLWCRSSLWTPASAPCSRLIATASHAPYSCRTDISSFFLPTLQPSNLQTLWFSSPSVVQQQPSLPGRRSRRSHLFQPRKVLRAPVLLARSGCTVRINISLELYNIGQTLIPSRFRLYRLRAHSLTGASMT